MEINSGVNNAPIIDPNIPPAGDPGNGDETTFDGSSDGGGDGDGEQAPTDGNAAGGDPTGDTTGGLPGDVTPKRTKKEAKAIARAESAAANAEQTPATNNKPLATKTVDARAIGTPAAPRPTSTNAQSLSSLAGKDRASVRNLSSGVTQSDLPIATVRALIKMDPTNFEIVE